MKERMRILFSLKTYIIINSVIDYNKKQSYDDSKKYPRMKITIQIAYAHNY